MKPRVTIFGMPLIAWAIYFPAMVGGGMVLDHKASWVHITWIVFVFLGVGVCGAIDQQQWHKRQKKYKEGEKT